MRIPGTFQVLLGVYILFTGSIPTIIQAVAFGLQGGGGDAFTVAMITATTFDLLLIAPAVLLSNHPLGILHPMLFAVVVWPEVLSMTHVFGDFGGWTGVFAGLPLHAPVFNSLANHSASSVWLAVAKFNCLQIIAVVFVYLGFFVSAGAPTRLRRAMPWRDSRSIRTVMIALISLSTVVFLYFLAERGGLNIHLTSLGRGRFRELSQYGIVILMIQIGAVALCVWLAAKPNDIKSPAFLFSMAVIMAEAFISNGSRTSMISVPLTAGVIWALRMQKIPWRIAVLLIPLLYVAIGAMGVVRTSVSFGSSASEELANGGWSKFFSAANEEIAGREEASADVPIVERGFSLTNGPLFGESYAAAVTAFIPRTLWRDKPRGIGPLYTRLFLHEPFEGGGIPVSPEVEMYWNFGIVGVIALSAIYGALLRIMYLFYWRRYPDPFATVFYVYFITSFQFSSSRLVPFEQRLLLIGLCYGAVRMFVRRLSDPTQSRGKGLAANPIRADHSAALFPSSSEEGQ
jgi:oligosaccharide repeat unit polymerase